MNYLMEVVDINDNKKYHTLQTNVISLESIKDLLKDLVPSEDLDRISRMSFDRFFTYGQHKTALQLKFKHHIKFALIKFSEIKTAKVYA